MRRLAQLAATTLLTIAATTGASALDPGQSVMYCTGANFGKDDAKTIEGCTNLINEATPMIDGKPNPKGKAAWYFSRGFAYARAGVYDKAIADFSKAIEVDPSAGDDGLIYHFRALAYSKAGGNAEKAKADRELACSKNKKYC